MSSKPKPVLTYFRARGRAETIRLMLAATEVEWKDAPYLKRPEEMAKLRADGTKLMFGQVPLLEWNNLNLVQSLATSRYIAEKGGLYGKTAEDKARIDMVTDGARDFLVPFLGEKFMPDDQYLRGCKTGIDKYLPLFEKILTKNASGFLVGKQMTMADVCLLEVTLLIEESDYTIDLDHHPKVKEHLHKMKAVPSIAKYLASAQRLPPNTVELFQEVRHVLGL